MNRIIVIIFILGIFSSCQARKSENKLPAAVSLTANQAARLDTAFLASGCFWCTEAVYERVAGVIEVVSGYSGGERKNPTYEQVSAGLTNYAEAVRVVYDPEVVSYETVLKIFFGSHDPTTLNRQGPDVGKQYRSAIFYRTYAEKQTAKDIKDYTDKSEKYKDPVVTEITRFKSFYIAEDYHQDYYEHHPENPYVQGVSRPKVEKFMKEFKSELKPEYQ